MNLPAFYCKQYTIAADDHLPNLFRELIVFGREWETVRHDRKLFEHCGS